MVDRISYVDLERMLADDATPDEAIAPYLRATGRHGMPFVPMVSAEEALVSAPATRGIVGLTVKSLNDRTNRQRRAAFRQKIDAGWKGLRLLAEGDSWFLYPLLLKDVVDNLSDDYAILSEAAAGDTLESMVSGREALSALIGEHRMHGLLLSGGGNDIAGDALKRYLSPPAGSSAEPAAYIGRAYGEFLGGSRDRLGELIGYLLKRHPELHIFCHGYDWPFPRDGGHWLSPAMTAHKVPRDVQPAILKAMIDRYYEMLFALGRKTGSRLHIIDCRGLVGAAPEWFDELHPANAGFTRVSDRFRTAVDGAFSVTRQRPAKPRAEIVWGNEWERASDRMHHKMFDIGSTITLGRGGDCDVALAGDGISDHHARVVIGPEAAQVEDLDSASGTFIDGASVRRSRWRPGQRLRLGGQVLSIAYAAAPPMAEVPLPKPMELRASPGEIEAEEAASAAGGTTVEIELISGNIAEVPSEAYVVGVFHQVNPLSSRGACNAIDEASGGAVASMAQSGPFNANLGEVSVLPLARQRGVMELILFAGLGALGSFAAKSLEIVGENVARMILTAKLGEFATIPIGGNAGISVESFARHFFAGLLRGLGQSPDAQPLRRIQLVEIDPARFAALGQALKEMAASGFFKESGLVVSVQEGPAAPARVAPGSKRQAGNGRDLAPVYLQVSSPSEGVFEYFMLSAALGATIQAHRLEIDPATLAKTAATAARTPNFDAETGGRLAAVYLPPTLREHIGQGLSGNAAHLVVIHDRASSAIPWETFYIDGRSPALELGVSRLYRLDRRERVSGRPTLPRGAAMRMLVVENPTGDLAGASSEGASLLELFSARHGNVTVLRGSEATRANVLSELASGTYDLLHYAGHADFEETAPEASGLLCHDGRLTAADLREVGRVPRLIFLNACESGRLRRAPPPPEAGQASSLLGASIGLAEGFLLSGVSNFIGTYWPVSDVAALKFAVTLYEALLRGEPMGLALRGARKEIQKLGPRDWANYMHFGDPLYRVRQG